jgi:hypothetical protein
MPSFGSMVQNGKFAAIAFWEQVTALNRLLLPTFGRPTIPASMGTHFVLRGGLERTQYRGVSEKWNRQGAASRYGRQQNMQMCEDQ